MARPMTITVMEDGSVVLAIEGERAIPLSLEDFQVLQKLVAPRPAPSLPPLEMIPPFPPIECLYGAMQEATIRVGG